jgi:hypothetical protein
LNIVKGNDVYTLEAPKNVKYLAESNIPYQVMLEETKKELGHSKTNRDNDEGRKTTTTDIKLSGKQFIAITEKGDKILVLRLRDDGIKLVKLVQEQERKTQDTAAPKKFKVDPSPMETKYLENNFSFDKGSKNYYFRIIPTMNDFIILGLDQA